jgi:putative hydrolase of the HAD superfamily
LPWRPAYATLAFVRLRNELGLERVRLHDLRHFTATRLLAGGQDVRTVSGRLGHANAATTLGVYAHFLEAADHDAAKVIGKLLDTSPAPGKLSHPLRTVPDVTELIVFDGDDTLWRVEHLYDAARSRAAEVVAREGLDPVAWAALQRQIDVANVQHFGLSRLRFPQSSVEAYEQLATESGVTVKPAVRDRVRSAAATVFDRKAPLMPGVREVLRTLKRDHRLALLTQGDPSIQKKRIGESGLGDFLDFIRVVDRKDEASFSTVLDALTTSPSAAWSVGNSIPSDINPALRLGMSAIWIEAPVWAHERREDGPAAGSFFVCKSLSDVPGLIRGHALVGQ